MLTAVIVWLYAGALCYAYGALFFRKLPFALTVLSGLVILTVLAQLVSLFMPMTAWLHLLLIAGALLLLAVRRIPRSILPGVLPCWPGVLAGVGGLVWVLTFLIVLENATHLPSNPDTNLYHAQAIRWMETYPAVPGLGNLHGRLAFNSAWFVTNALFGMAFLGQGSFPLAAGLLALIALSFFWQGMMTLLAGQVSVSNLLKTGFLPLTFYALGGELSSPGADLPVSLLVWVLTILWVEQVENEQPYHLPLMTLLAAFAVSVKLSALPLLAFPLLLARFQKRRLFTLGWITTLVLLPFVARNLVLSGYLVYPYPTVDLFAFDWKVPPERVEEDRQAVIAFARWVGPGQFDAPFQEWFPHWFSRQSLNRRVLFFAALLTPLAGLIVRFRPLRLWAGWLVVYGGVCFWFFSAPDFRFGYGFLLASLLLVSAIGFWMGVTRFPWLSRFLSFGGTALMLVYLALTLVRSFEPRTLSERLLRPVGYIQVPVQECALANAPAFCAVNYGYCGYHELPCVPSPRHWVEQRGDDLRDGFRALPR
ncbi:MAG: hypothetical protein N2117_09040 [Anaerolineales bacterium]|nr:hypothetical protein [Anaerolineales bacterium]